jgi:hypothetical protein
MFSMTVVTALILAGAAANESRLHADFRTEGERFKGTCAFDVSKVAGCAALLLTDHPLHVAVGSIAPQNGFAVGGAFVTHFTPSEDWRISWNSDAVGALGGGAWRAGTYLKIIATPIEPPHPVAHAKASAIAGLSDFEHPIITAYAQMISLPTVFFYGLGPDSARSGQTAFGFSEGIIGTTATLPLFRKSSAQALKLTAAGEVNERLPSVRSGTSSTVASIDTRYSNADAPGLDTQPATTQFGEGLRARPSFFGDHVALDYLVEWQQFVATDSAYSFRRWTVDLRHEIRLYGTSFPGAYQTNGPNECAADPKADCFADVKRAFAKACEADATCPQSHNRVGTILLRGFVSRSQTSGTSAVPFYFQQTIGGSDINGNRVLAGYDDYRFRGSGVVLVQGSLEHSLGKWPIGLFVEGDGGNVMLPSQSLSAVRFHGSAALGLNIRAGGFPAFTVAYAKGAEGHHAIYVLSTALLGGSARPSLQ